MTTASRWAGRRTWMAPVETGGGAPAHVTGPRSIPLFERPGAWRGVLELITGAYPRFVFGGSIRGVLPVFHIHDTTAEALEPYLAYLSANDYRTVTTDALSRLLIAGVHPGPRSVLLCFDDAWATVWTVAEPLLRRFGLQAVTFAIPFRTEDAAAVRPQATGEVAGPTFATWPELRALVAAGTVDVQCHSWSHSAIVSSDRLRGFVTPSGPRLQVLEWPWAAGLGRYLGAHDHGAPLFAERSRLSNTPRYLDDDARAACMDRVARGGGAAFFERPAWDTELSALVERYRGHFEHPDQRRAAIEEELARGREELESRLGTPVRHFCAPWGVAARDVVAALPACGYETAFTDHWPGRRIVKPGDQPFQLMRLHERYIHCLPGTGRASWLAVARRSR